MAKKNESMTDTSLYSIISINKPVNEWGGLTPFVLAAGSYIFYHKKQKAISTN